MVETKFQDTEIGKIPREWNIKKIGSLLTIGNGKDYKHLSNGDVPVYGTGGYMTSVSDFLYEGETVCIGRKGTIDVPQYHNGKIWTVDTLFYCFNFKGVLPKYLFYVFHRVDWNSYNEATGVPSLTSKNIYRVSIPVPIIEEQQTIVEKLTNSEKLIETLSLLIEKKRAIKEGSMQELLTGKKRLPGFSAPWKDKKLGDNATIQRGGSPRPIEAYLTNSPDGINWIKIGDVRPNDKYIRNTEEKIIPQGVSRSRQVYKGDFILSNSMSFGRPYILDIDGCIHDGWLVIKDYQSTYDMNFLYYMLGSQAIMEQYIAMAAGSSVKNLNKDKVSAVRIYAPCDIEEQKAIANILNQMDEEIVLLEQKRTKYMDIKDGMMQQLLTGKIRLI